MKIDTNKRQSKLKMNKLLKMLKKYMLFFEKKQMKPKNVCKI